MTENLMKFLEAVSNNAELKKKLTNASQEDVFKQAAGLGIVLSDADFEQKNELNNDDLEVVVGGGGCGCAFGGGGGGTDDEDGKTYGCACVVYGQGGDGKINDVNCLCALGGAGTDLNLR